MEISAFEKSAELKDLLGLRGKKWVTGSSRPIEGFTTVAMGEFYAIKAVDQEGAIVDLVDGGVTLSNVPIPCQGTYEGKLTSVTWKSGGRVACFNA